MFTVSTGTSYFQQEIQMRSRGALALTNLTRELDMFDINRTKLPLLNIASSESIGTIDNMTSCTLFRIGVRKGVVYITGAMRRRGDGRESYRHKLVGQTSSRGHKSPDNQKLRRRLTLCELISRQN